MGLKGAASLNEVVFGKHHHHQYASTPHLFVFQAAEDYDENSSVEDTVTEEAGSHCGSSTSTGEAGSTSGSSQRSKEPIYSSTTLDVRKQNINMQQNENVQLRIDNSYPQETEEYIPEDPLAVTEDDIARIETFFKGHMTQVWVCNTMANLYNETHSGGENSAPTWQLKFTGVPLLLLDAGETKSRNKRKLQLILAEKGTGFALWRDTVDNLTSYKVEQPHFHTLYLSSDHRQRLGLSFNDGDFALDFHAILEELISNPANISLSGPGKKNKKDKSKEKTPKYKAPKKADISLPCNFNHVTNVDPTDKSRFFSLQLFSRKAPTTQPIQPHIMIEKINTDDAIMKQKVIQV